MAAAAAAEGDHCCEGGCEGARVFSLVGNTVGKCVGARDPTPLGCTARVGCSEGSSTCVGRYVVFAVWPSGDGCGVGKCEGCGVGANSASTSTMPSGPAGNDP